MFSNLKKGKEKLQREKKSLTTQYSVLITVRQVLNRQKVQKKFARQRKSLSQRKKNQQIRHLQFKQIYLTISAEELPTWR